MQQSDSYARQRRGKFPVLRFEPPLETEFRAWYATRSPGFLAASLALCIALVAVACVLDVLERDAGLGLQSTATRVLLIVLPASLALLATRSSALRPYLPRLVIATAAGTSAGIVLLTALAVAHGGEPPVLDGAVLSLLICLLLGLRFYTAVALALPIAAVVAAAVALQDGAEGASRIALVLAAISIGALACRRMEHTARTSFLERQMLNVLVGGDAAAPVWDRRSFPRKLSSLRRQAARDKRSLALLLVEIDQLGDFECLYGRLAAETVLRRVSRAIMTGARRPLDCAARLGGAQFIVALYDPEREYVYDLAAELRAAVARLDIANGAAPSGTLSVTIGAALSPPHRPHDSEELLSVAERALRAAKWRTRDGIVVRSVLQPNGPTVTAGPWRAREPA